MTRVRLLGVRYDERSSFLRGAAGAPPLIRAALFSEASNAWTESGIDLEGRIDDRGDLDPGSGEAALAAIEDAMAGLLAEPSGAPLVLGGDHSITCPLLRAVAKRHGPVSILHLDAHPDLYDAFGGDRYSHASPFARVCEEGLARRLVQVGIRAANGHQLEQARRFGVEQPPSAAWDAPLALEPPVYVSIDMDGLDPACAPGVAHREPGGLSVRQALGWIHAQRRGVVGADVVELNPAQDLGGVTAVVAAKLVKELAGVMLR